MYDAPVQLFILRPLFPQLNFRIPISLQTTNKKLWNYLLQFYTVFKYLNLAEYTTYKTNFEVKNI